MFKGYVINLDRSPERLAKFNQHPDSIYFHRFSAIDKREFESIPNIKKLLFDDSVIKQKYARTNVSLGEICCTLSHIACWKLAAEDSSLSDDDYVVIAEDDVSLVPHFGKLVSELEINMKKSASNIILLQKLGGRIDYWKTAIANSNMSVYPIIFDNYHEYDNDGASLYLIRKSFAKQMVNKLARIKPFWLADMFTSFCDGANITVANPLLGYIENGSESYIWDGYFPVKRTKVVFVHLSLIIGGSETVLINYLKMLAGNPNYEVELLLINEPDQNLLKSLIPSNVKVSHILSSIESEFKTFLFWKLKDSITEQEKHYFGSWDLGIKIRQNNRLLKFFTENKFDLVINFNEHLDDYLLHYDTGAKNIRWVHIKDDIDKYLANSTYYRNILAKHSAIISISNDMKLLVDNMLNEMALPVKSEMLYNPLDDQKILALSEQAEDGDRVLLAQPFILSVARLFEYKNHLQMIDIYANLKEKGIKEKLYIIGEGHGHVKTAIQERIKQLYLEDDCILLGSRNNPFPFMKAAKLFIHTSLVEGFGLVLVESMICGTPVIVFDCPTGPREILNNGEFGALIPLKDETLFIEQAYQLLTNEEKLNSYKDKLSEAIKPFTFNVIREQFFEILDKQGLHNA